MMRTAALLLLACLGLSSCGQKGPLYLPQEEKPKAEAPADAQTTLP